MPSSKKKAPGAQRPMSDFLKQSNKGSKSSRNKKRDSTQRSPRSKGNAAQSGAPITPQVDLQSVTTSTSAPMHQEGPATSPASKGNSLKKTRHGATPSPSKTPGRPPRGRPGLAEQTPHPTEREETANEAEVLPVPPTQPPLRDTDVARQARSLVPSPPTRQVAFTRQEATPMEPTAPTPLTLLVEVTGPIKRAWGRVVSKVQLPDFPSLTAEDFSPSSGSVASNKIQGLLNNTSHFRVFQEGRGTMDHCDDIVKSALDRHFPSDNAFYQPETRDQGLASKESCLRLLICLGRTRVTVLPSWNSSARSLEDPSIHEMLWYAFYKVMGPVADLDAARQVDIQRQTAAVANGGALAMEGAQGTTAVKKHQKPRKHLRKAHDYQRKHSMFLLVRGAPSPPHTAGDFKTQTASHLEYFNQMRTVLQKACPDIILMADPSSSKYRKNPAPDIGPFDDELIPKSRVEARNYWAAFFITAMGNDPVFKIRVKHDEEPNTMIDRLNAVHELWQFETHPHQQWDVAKVAWLGCTTKDTDCDTLGKAIEDHSLFKLLKQEHPHLRLMLHYDIIRLSPTEKVDYTKFVRAVTIEVPTELGMTVLTTLQNIYSPDKRKDLPLDRRYALYANGGDPHVSLRGSSLEVLEKARELQKNYIRSVATMQLEDCIKDPNAPVYGGGPPPADYCSWTQTSQGELPFDFGHGQDTQERS